MGNQTRGIFDIKFEGQKLKLQYTANGMAEVEDASGMGFMKFLEGCEKAAASGDLRVGDVRLLFWGGLLEHQPKMTVIEAGRVITELGGVAPAMEKLGEAIQASMPEAEGDEGDISTGKQRKTA